MPTSQPLTAYPFDTRRPLQMPLMGAWFCKNFSVLLMLPLYAVALACSGVARLFQPRSAQSSADLDASALDDLVTAYPTSLYPTLSVLLQANAYQAEAGDRFESRLDIGLSGPYEDQTALTLQPWQASSLPLGSASLDRYRLNNVIHQTEQRYQVLQEAARVLRPGGLLQVTDNTVGGSTPYGRSAWLGR